MDADEHGYLDGGFIRVHLRSSVVLSFFIGFAAKQ